MPLGEWYVLGVLSEHVGMGPLVLAGVGIHMARIIPAEAGWKGMSYTRWLHLRKLVPHSFEVVEVRGDGRVLGLHHGDTTLEQALGT